MSKRAILGLSLLILFPVGIYSCVNMICQHRAEYMDSITFIGKPQYIFGTLYTRVHMWRDPADISPLPDVTVYLDGMPYRLDTFTPELVQEFGSSPVHGSFIDTSSNVFSYRFTNDKLTNFRFEYIGRPDKPASTSNISSVSLALGEGPPFAMPINHRTLRQFAGKPDRSYLHFAQ